MTMKFILVILVLAIISVTSLLKGAQPVTNNSDCLKLIYEFKCNFNKTEINKRDCNVTTSTISFYSLNDKNCIILLKKSSKTENRNLKCILDYPNTTKDVKESMELICAPKNVPPNCNSTSKIITIINNGSGLYSFVLLRNKTKKECYIINNNDPNKKYYFLTDSTISSNLTKNNDDKITITTATNSFNQESTTSKCANLNNLTPSILPKNEIKSITSEKSPGSTDNNYYFIPDDSLKKYLQAILAFTIIFVIIIILGTLIFLRRRGFRWKMKNSIHANFKLQENITASNKTQPRHNASQEALNDNIYANLVNFPSQKRNEKAVTEEAVPLQTKNTPPQQTKICAGKEPEVVYTQVIVTRKSSLSGETKVPHYDINNVTYAASKRNRSQKKIILTPNQHI